MEFQELKLKGAFLIKGDRFADDRGHFERTYCQKEMAARGLVSQFVQHNVSFSREAGTLRGMHFQKAPFAEVKMLRVTSGKIFDVIVDLRKGSETFGQWTSVELEVQGPSLYVPTGFAHGLQTLLPNTEVQYLMSEFYQAEAAGTLFYKDPELNIPWPLPVSSISEKDRNGTPLKGLKL